ncbi:FAD binding domain-containing protein [Chloroflexota bacterium]
MKILETINVYSGEEAASPAKLSETNGLISTDYLPKFIHINTRTIHEAIFLLQTYEERATVIAGGTTLLRELKRRVQPILPGVLINLKSIIKPKLDYIIEDELCIRIGSTTKLSKIVTNEIILRKFAMLAQSAKLSGFPQYRNMATIGGEICQHVKCWYYQSSNNLYYCHRKGGNTCQAIEGDNRYHAIYDIKDCCAVCASEIAPILVAMDAKAKITGIGGEQIVKFEDFFTPLGNTLQHTDILTEIQIPNATINSKGSFIKVGLRNEFDPAIASVSILATIIDKVCTHAKIVLGGVCAIPNRAICAEKMITGKIISDELAKKAAQITAQAATPLQMNTYKLDLIESLVKRAILELI